MPCCVAVGYSNRPGKAVKVHRFPSDPNRRKAWEIKINRLNWTATKYSVLCQAHFDENQFEQNRSDGMRKLKPNATPSSFSYWKHIIPSKTPHKGVIETTYEYVPPEKLMKIEHSYNKDLSQEESTIDDEVLDENKCLQQVTILPPDSITKTLTRECELEILKLKVKELQTKLDKINKDFANERKSKRKILMAKRKQDLKISEVFNSDQLMALGRKSTRGSKWSIETIKKALQLRIACGPTGYQLLLSQGQPLPSMRTLRRYDNTLDEMPVSQGIDYESGTIELLGYATIEDPQVGLGIDYQPQATDQ